MTEQREHRLPTLRVLSLFAGIGGIDLGLEATGRFKTIAFAEVDTHASQVLAKHWPQVPNLGDVTSIDWTEWEGAVDVIAAGFPCQDISVAGKQEGITDGTRSGLWFEVVRAARIVRPRYLLLENVAAITSSNGGSDLGTVLGDLAALGFDAEWACVRASDVGAPHQRARWFCIAWMGDYSHDGHATRSFARSDGSTNDNSATGQNVASEPTRTGRARFVRELGHPDGERGERSRDIAGTAGEREPAHTGGSVANTDKQRTQVPTTGIVATKPRTGSDSDSPGTRIFTAPRQHPYWNTGIVGPGGRLIEPSIRLLAHGVPQRVGQLRAYGNAVVPAVAQHVGECLARFDDEREIA